MEENKVLKISLLTIILILSIIAITVMCVFMCKFYNNKVEANKKIDELQSRVSDLNETVIKPEKKISKEYIKIINEIEKEYPESNITSDLIYFNDDNVPDLVIGELGYWVSLYIYQNGEVYNIVDNWQYGISGNPGYKYQEKKGTILNYNSDFAGAVFSKNIYVLNSKNKLDTLYFRQRATDENMDDEEINEYLELYGGHFYNDKKISEQEYNNKLKELSVNINENNSKELNAKRSTVEIKKQLEKNNI